MRKYVIVGLGARSRMFQEAITELFRKNARLVGVCDSNPGRLELALRKLRHREPGLIGYSDTDFDRMIEQQSPDEVVVCTPDSLHDKYICRAMELDCDVITEKPMTIDAERCRRIVQMAHRTGKNIRVAFNYRYSPPRSQLKELLMKGVIGHIHAVDLHWMLDTCHGADYFRRWHRLKANSGGLLIHKATHHFDLVNFWLSDVPMSVYCRGANLFYNENQAQRYGLQGHGARCLECPVSAKCNFFLDGRSFTDIKELYLDCELHDGYFRDRCVFSDEIDIEDAMSVVVRYRQGAILTYSLNAFCPWEGYRITFYGTKGCLEHHCQESSYVSGTGGVSAEFRQDGTWTRVFPHFRDPYVVPTKQGQGNHGGGDLVMLNDIFGTAFADPLRRAADYRQGAYSILVGIAANISMKEDRHVEIDQLVSDLGDPGFPEMNYDDGDIPFVSGAIRVNDQGEASSTNLPGSIVAPA